MIRYVGAFVVSVGLLRVLAAQQPPAAAPKEPAVRLEAGETVVPGECLTKEELTLMSRLQALKRPTLGVETAGEGDDQPRFNPNYLLGTWTIEGTLPESPLGPAGDFVGSETVRYADHCTYESTAKIKRPDQAITITSVTVYDRRAMYMVRQERDSRGFELLKTGAVGGDAGGYFSHHWDAPQITLKGGRKVRLKGTSFFASPENYRLRMQISVDGGPFANYGTIWWRRDGAKP